MHEHEIEVRWRPELSVFDPTPVFCDIHCCRSVFQGKLLYWDDNHLDDEGSRHLAFSLNEWLRLQFDNVTQLSSWHREVKIRNPNALSDHFLFARQKLA